MYAARGRSSPTLAPIRRLDYPVKLDFQQVGARVEVADGIDDTTAIVHQLAKVLKFRVTPIEGDSAEVKVTAFALCLGAYTSTGAIRASPLPAIQATLPPRGTAYGV